LNCVISTLLIIFHVFSKRFSSHSHRDVTHILINFNCFSRHRQKVATFTLLQLHCATHGVGSLIQITESLRYGWRDIHYLTMRLHKSHLLLNLCFWRLFHKFSLHVFRQSSRADFKWSNDFFLTQLRYYI
jgi:hypothetical protein